MTPARRRALFTVAALLAASCRDYDRFRQAPGAGARDCLAMPRACGFPDETTTGSPTGTALREEHGAWVVEQAGATVTGLDLFSTLTVRAPDVTIRALRVHVGPYWGIIQATGVSAGGLVIEDVEIVGESAPESVAIACDDCTVRRVHIHHVGSGFRVGSRARVEASYVHDVVRDAFSSEGGTGFSARGNTLRGPTSGAGNCVFLSNGFGALENVVIEGNLLSGGQSIVNAGTGEGVPNVSVLANRIERRAPESLLTTSSAGAHVRWEGNLWDDTGEPVAQPE